MPPYNQGYQAPPRQMNPSGGGFRQQFQPPQQQQKQGGGFWKGLGNALKAPFTGGSTTNNYYGGGGMNQGMMRPPMGGMNRPPMGGFGRAMQQGGQMNPQMGPKPPMGQMQTTIPQQPGNVGTGGYQPWKQYGGNNPYQTGISENPNQQITPEQSKGIMDYFKQGRMNNPYGQNHPDQQYMPRPSPGPGMATTMDMIKNPHYQGNQPYPQETPMQGGIGPSDEQIQQQWNQDPRMQNFRSPMEGGYAPPWMQS